MARSSATSRDLRHRVLTCVTKLTDRDTHTAAVAELESIIPTLTAETFSLFISSLSSTSTADRAAVRSASLRLLASLSSSHRHSLSSHLPKLVSAVVRRLRDPDSAVRSAAAAATGAFVANITNAASFSSILRPLADSLSTEQDLSAQSAAALCLAAAVDASPEIDAAQIVKLIPKWMKLLKCDAFKAKSALLVLIRSAMRVCEIANSNLLRDLVSCLVEFLKSEDWQARKAAAEALKDIAIVERDSLSELKSPCLKTFEARKFDKVKAAREAMTQMVEAWKEIPDVFDDGSPPPHSQASSKENASDGRYPARSRISSVVDSNTPQTRQKHVPLRRSSPSDSALKTTAANRRAQDVIAKKSSSLSFRKLDYEKHPSNNVDATDFHHSSVTPLHEDSLVEDDEGILQRADVRIVRTSKTEMRRGLFSKHPGRVVPYPGDGYEASVVVSNASTNTCGHRKDCEDLSLIRKQLVQIENQQSSLMDLLQKFIGSSQDGMRTLETRVHGLEQALDDISYDLAVSTARMSVIEPARTSCCSLPGSDFLSSKFWRRQEARGSTSRFSFSGSTPSVSAMHNIADKNPASNAYKLENRKFHLRSAGGVIVNPLAHIHGDSRKVSEASSSRMLKSVHGVA